MSPGSASQMATTNSKPEAKELLTLQFIGYKAEQRIAHSEYSVGKSQN